MSRVHELLQGHRVLQRLHTFADRHRLDLFLVGGTVRDMCLGRETQDLDVALSGDVMAVARAFAHEIGGTYVPLDPEHGEARVVYRRQTVVDFARFKGHDITEDLGQRDFTIDALACPLSTFMESRTPDLVDPCSGWRDLQGRVIRLISPQGFEDDPLRLLRAFRLAATLELTVVDSTLEHMQRTVARIVDVAAERIHTELLRLLAAPCSAPQGEAMARLGLLDALFPELAATHGVTQNRCHHLDVFEHSLLTYRSTEAVINSPAVYLSAVADPVSAYLQADERAALLKWAALLHDIGKPATCRVTAHGQVTFVRHATHGAQLWEQMARRLKLSTARADYIKTLIAHHRLPLQLHRRDRQGRLTLRLVHEWFKALGEDVLGLFVLAIGDALASRGPRTPANRSVVLGQLGVQLWQVYQRRILPVLTRPRLVTGHDLQEVFGLTPGPQFKTLLEEIEVAQVEGRIRTRAAALRWVERQIRVMGQ
jgi:poly(A) polymerase